MLVLVSSLNFIQSIPPLRSPKKYDPTGALVRYYCPELRNFPDKYIYELWLASDSEQRKVGCVIGRDYPERMLDDRERKEVCLVRMRIAYDVGFKGDAKEVMEGTADQILKENYKTAAPPPTPKRKRDEKEKGQQLMVNGGN